MSQKRREIKEIFVLGRRGPQLIFVQAPLLPDLSLFFTVYRDLLDDKPRGSLVRVARIRAVGGRDGLVHGRPRPRLDSCHRAAGILQGARLPRGKERHRDSKLVD